jgi:diguanylate cyclase (GGDEF)-like protein
MEGVVKSEQSQQAGAVPPVVTRWFKDKKGGLSLWRTFMLLFILTLASALIVAAGGLGPGFGAVLVAILSAALVYALILTPLARDYEARQADKPRASVDSTQDALTRIPNRRGITTSLLDAMAYANRYGHPLSVGMVDLDMLSDINQGLGRRAGDKALQIVASVFTDTLRMPDRAGRFGDEEFLVILPNTQLKNALKIAERIRDGVESANGTGSKKFPLTVSIGVAQFKKGEDLERFLMRVNKALTLAKTAGRNRVATDRPVAS